MFGFFQLSKRKNTQNHVDEGLENEIKQFFFEHHGDGMSMDRADPEKYDRYCTIGEGRVEAWRQELIALDLELLSSRRDLPNAWITVGNLLRLISRSHTMREPNAESLLNQLVALAPLLDKRQRILILEHFAGRTSHQMDGGIYMISATTDLVELLIRVVDLLSDLQIDASDNTDEPGWQDVERRYAEVRLAIRQAYGKFGVTIQ